MWWTHNVGINVQNSRGWEGCFGIKLNHIVVVGKWEDTFGCFDGADWGREGLRGHTSFLLSGHSSGGLPGRRNKDPHSPQQELLQKVSLIWVMLTNVIAYGGRNGWLRTWVEESVACDEADHHADEQLDGVGHRHLEHCQFEPALYLSPSRTSWSWLCWIPA